MFSTLPKNAPEFMHWSWSQIEPYTQDLIDRSLDSSNVTQWLTDWSDLSRLVEEMRQRLYVAVTVDTTDQGAKKRFDVFLDEIHPAFRAADQKLKEKLLSSGLEPAGFEIPLRNIKTLASIFRHANLPLLSEEQKLVNEYDRIAGAQTVVWEGEEITIPQLQPVYQNLDRQVREQAWRLASERQLADRQTLSELWGKLMGVRGQLAANADFPEYRAYRWRQMLRFAYTPEDCFDFQDAIEEVVVPVAVRLYERRRQRLCVETLRPWDLRVDALGREPLRPFEDVAELVEKTATIFNRVDPQLGAYFENMRGEGLLDLENRKGKAPGGYCTNFDMARQPFIFMNAVGIHDDVQTLLHEGGHAFHVYESAHLPYHQQLQVGLEFAEVASTAMELLSVVYLPTDQGGFYTEADTARARVQFLEESILFWPYMAVVDAFQHWAYENHAAASDPAQCDAKWSQLWERFMVGVDWSGLDDAMMTGWQRKLHIFEDPFYYIEYGLAALGALQVWHNSLSDQAGALAAYRKALSLGGTVPLPKLYATAGAKLAFDAATLREAVDLALETIDTLERE